MKIAHVCRFGVQSVFYLSKPCIMQTWSYLDNGCKNVCLSYTEQRHSAGQCCESKCSLESAVVQSVALTLNNTSFDPSCVTTFSASKFQFPEVLRDLLRVSPQNRTRTAFIVLQQESWLVSTASVDSSCRGVCSVFSFSLLRFPLGRTEDCGRNRVGI